MPALERPDVKRRLAKIGAEVQIQSRTDHSFGRSLEGPARYAAKKNEDRSTIHVQQGEDLDDAIQIHADVPGSDADFEAFAHTAAVAFGAQAGE